MGTIPQEILRELPVYLATDYLPWEMKTARARLFSPLNGWSWYLVEADPDGYCFGLVFGWESEWGPWTLQEIAEVNRSIPGAVLYDETFTPTTMDEVAEFHARNGELFGQPWAEGR